MGQHTQDNGKMVKEMGLESTLGGMEHSTEVVGRMT